jgi:ribose-phosphate pyrophosphokinase
MNTNSVLVPLPGFEPLAASVTGMDIVRPICTRFRNREIAVRLPRQVADRDCVLLGTAAPPAERLIELLLAADTLTRNGAQSVCAMLPYLAYARQDHPELGHSLAAAWLGRALSAAGVGAVTTIDIHSDAARELIGLPVASLSPARLFTRALADTISAESVVVAPDRGAVTRASEMADALGVERPVAWLDKERTAAGVTQARILGELDRNAIVVDDILDTGGTLLSCCHELRSHGVERLTIAVTHGLFTGSAWHALGDLGVDTIHTTDSIPAVWLRASRLVSVHSIAPLLAEALAQPVTLQVND